MSLYDIDLQVFRIFNHPSSISVDIYIVTAIFTVYAFLIFLVYNYFRQNNKAKFAHLVLSAIIGYFVVTVIKQIVARPRPYETVGAEAVITKPYDPYGFPSGHSFIVFLLLNFLPPSWPKLAKYLAAAYIIFVPIGSMYIGVHYPSDVFVGSLLGYLFPKILSEKTSTKIFDKISNLHL